VVFGEFLPIGNFFFSKYENNCSKIAKLGIFLKILSDFTSSSIDSLKINYIYIYNNVQIIVILFSIH